eukprot:jgi/Chlat1/413/Chrsp10S00055
MQTPLSVTHRTRKSWLTSTSPSSQAKRHRLLRITLISGILLSIALTLQASLLKASLGDHPSKQQHRRQLAAISGAVEISPRAEFPRRISTLCLGMDPMSQDYVELCRHGRPISTAGPKISTLQQQEKWPLDNKGSDFAANLLTEDDIVVVMLKQNTTSTNVHTAMDTWLKRAPHLISEQSVGEALVHATRMQGGQFKWFIVGDDDVYFIIRNIVRYLASLDSSKSHFIGLPHEPASPFARVTRSCDIDGSRCSDNHCHAVDITNSGAECHPNPGSPIPASLKLGTGYILSAGLVKDLTERCASLDSHTQLANCIYQTCDIAMTEGPQGSFFKETYSGEAVIMPKGSPWSGPFAFPNTAGSDARDLFFVENSENGIGEEPIAACFKWDSPAIVIKGNDAWSRFAGLGDRLTDVFGAWTVSWSLCRPSLVPWLTRGFRFPPWESMFAGSGERGMTVVSANDTEAFYSRLGVLDPLSPLSLLPLSSSSASGRALPERLYQSQHLYKQRISLSQTKATYLMLASRLQLRDEVEKKVEGMKEVLKGSVALHVRRGDKVRNVNETWAERSVELSFHQLQEVEDSTEKFIVDLLKEIPWTRFFVTSDDRDAELRYTKLIVRSGGRVVRTVKAFDRKLNHGVGNAVEDMVLMSKCAGILQSAKISSYSANSMVIGRVPLLNLLPDNTRQFAHGPDNVNVPFLYELAFPYEARDMWLEQVRDRIGPDTRTSLAQRREKEFLRKRQMAR